MSEENNGIDVGYVAKLACIDLTEEEKELFHGQLDQVLHYVEQLNELDVSDVEPTAHAIPVFNVFRKDEVGTSLNHQEVIANFPSAADGHVRVPKIIDQ
ncbi:Asp-tRNA(Asn)/Glu-tRNA(Gln) amidotransferase subunit GatC [Pontiella agarivorans]|uniref:Aspartyl/glutamyl-tRNA(Asn/Gln) amidotransferase subunit C n=1 Tax=Pontiella agarivorans TaxID=3038953 RepID=A0ABU5MT69_9BACT|nr:Asp-tRNA(Asn)/Glu-tRNA(Gln) amidotransferase subunit GatC [Pontiella agarivorans]MDZ8117398.1 Asp-tRNA(Asn)/Glu-tRNA(Gln) amidotransferase subunit GatC [Pontiella agarivorans]